VTDLIQSMLKRVTKTQHQAVIGGHSIDLFLPEWNIAIEYQGEQHYQQHYRGCLVKYEL
jgi:very-short-patch-repair endonuclease